MIIGVRTSCCLNSRQTSKPFFFGSITSRIRRSKDSPAARLKPSSPSRETSTAKPSLFRRSFSVMTRPGSSSTNRMRRFIIARGSALGRFGNNPRGGRNQYAEATSAARGTFNVNSSSVRLDYVPHEAQPQPVPMDLRSESIAAPIKRLEYSRELRRFDTKAAVFDRYPHNRTSRGVLIAGSDSNTATIASVLDRVAYQILDRAAQRRGVCSDQRQGRVDMLVEYKVVLSDDRIRSGDCVVYYICDGRRLEVVSSPAGLYPR